MRRFSWRFPLITLKKHQQELDKLRKQLNKRCNTGCQTARCRGDYKDPRTNGSRVGHTFAPPGKRVLVTLHNGDNFVAKFKEKTGRFHIFHDHDKVKSSNVKQLSILTTDYQEKNI